MELNAMPAYRCPPCHAKAERAAEERRVRRKRQDIEAADKKKRSIGFFDRLAKKKLDAAHISELCEEIVGEFGGLHQFARFFVAQTMAAAARNPGGKVALDACAKVISIIVASTEHRKSAPDVENLTDEDIEKEVRSIIGIGFARPMLPAPMEVAAEVSPPPVVGEAVVEKPATVPFEPLKQAATEEESVEASCEEVRE
jgi:hypothetical protein